MTIKTDSGSAVLGDADGRKRFFKGVLCIVASAFGFAMMAFFVRLADDYGPAISCFQKSFFRNAIALAIALAVLVLPKKADGRRVETSFKVAMLLVARSVLGTAGIFANFKAISVIPIGEAMTLNKTAPFFTVLFSWLFLKEKVSRLQAVALVVAFAGAVLVMKPGFGIDSSPAHIIALFGGLSAGGAYVCVHQLGRLGYSGAKTVFFFSVFSCIASLPPAAAMYVPMTSAQAWILVGAGASAAVGQFGVTAAYRYAEPRKIAVFDYSNVIFAGVLGFAFFGQMPDLLSMAGFVLILLAASASV